MVRYLLSQKVKVDCTTSTGYTPLHQAAQQGNSAIVAVLLDNGASPDSKNNVSNFKLARIGKFKKKLFFWGGEGGFE